MLLKMRNNFKIFDESNNLKQKQKTHTIIFIMIYLVLICTYKLKKLKCDKNRNEK
jgi:hypothetical protein